MHATALPIREAAAPRRSANDDLELVRRFQAGDRRAFELLYRRHAPRVMRMALRMTGSNADAEDVTQHVFERVFRALPRFRIRDAQISTWLYRVTSNACFDHLKARRRRTTRREGLRHEPSSTPDAALTPEAHLAKEQARDLVGVALLRIPEKYRVVVVLRDIEQRSYKEMRSILGLPITTLKMRAVRGREKLAHAVDRLGGAP